MTTPGLSRRARLQLPSPAALLGEAAGGSSAPAAPGSGRPQSQRAARDVEFVWGHGTLASMARLKVVRERGGKGDRGFGPGKLWTPGSIQGARLDIEAWSNLGEWNVSLPMAGDGMR